MSKENDSVVSRRRVFAGAGGVGALAAAAAALPLLKPATPEPASAADSLAQADADGRYQATPHVLHYYRTARV